MERLSKCLEKLADMGNTIIVMEHDLDFMTRADWFIDLGPGGGRLLFQGWPGVFLSQLESSRTARELSCFLGRHHPCISHKKRGKGAKNAS